MLDPNLVLLADAYKTALAKMSGEADEPAAASISHSSGSEDEPAQRHTGSAVPASALPGLYKRRRRPSDEVAAEEGTSSEEGEPGRFVKADAAARVGGACNRASSQPLATGKLPGEQGATMRQKQRRHALPGRLRKKLAMERGKKDGAAG